MATPKLRVEISFNDTTGDPVAAYLRIREGKVSETKEISEGVAFADYAQDFGTTSWDRALSPPARPPFLTASRNRNRSRFGDFCEAVFVRR